MVVPEPHIAACNHGDLDLTWPLIPPIAIPCTVRDVLSARPWSADARFLCEFAHSLSEVFAPYRAFLCGEGRVGLAALLARWARPDRTSVLVPAYTCWSVPAAIVRAGLAVRMVDVDPHTLAPRPEDVELAADGSLVAAIFPHLFGELPELRLGMRGLRTRDPGVRLIEDCAQCWPARPDAFADALLLSFGRGKPLPLGAGGAVLVRDDDLEGSPPPSGPGLRTGLQFIAAVILSHPFLYRLPASIPALGIGTTVYDPAFRADAPFHPWQARLGLRLLPRISSLVEARRQRALALLETIRGVPGWEVPAGLAATGPLRLPVLAPDRKARDHTMRRLIRRGVGASAMYPGTLADIPELAPHLSGPLTEFPGARALADRLITLPCHPMLNERATVRIAHIFEELAVAGGTAG